MFLGLSGLRALQDETGDTFTGDWSWVPYLIMFVALLVGAGARVARPHRPQGREGVRMSMRPVPAPTSRSPAPTSRRKLAQIRGVADDTTEVAEDATKTGLVVAGVGVVVVVFLLGRGRGRKKSTIVEIRRI